MRVFIVAYSCEPGRGSEPGAGWGVVRAAATLADCVVAVAPEHHAAVEAHVAAEPGLSLRVVTVPEPRWHHAVAWHRIGRFLSYAAWQRRVRELAAMEHAAEAFDLAHHVTFAIYWLPSAVTSLDIPAVWGPVGGAVTTPLRLWPALGIRGLASEILDLVAVRMAALLPATRRTWRQSSVRIGQNPATANALPDPTRVWNHGELVQPASAASVADIDTQVTWIGALESRKGPTLAVRALAEAPGLRLKMVGDGPARRSVDRLARRLGVADRLDLVGRVSRDEVAALLRSTSCALFTGLREEGGLALAEALAAGTPCVILDIGGAGVLGRAATDPTRVSLVEPGGVRSTARRLADAMSAFAADPSADRSPMLREEAAISKLRAAYEAALAGDDDSASRPADE